MPASGKRAAQQTRGGVLYWVVFTTIHSISWEDHYLVAAERLTASLSEAGGYEGRVEYLPPR